MRTGKIARLPDQLREQLNQRLLDAEPADAILPWLNSLPEVQTLLAAQFDARPINPMNLSEWRRGGFRDWQVQRHALNFLDSLQDRHALGHQALAAPCSAKLLHWLLLQYAAATQSLDENSTDPAAHLARLRHLAADLTRLRRSELHAEHVALEHQWLALEQTKTRDYMENVFWAWTKRPEIKAKLKSKRPPPPQSSIFDHPDFIKAILGKSPTSDDGQ